MLARMNAAQFDDAGSREVEERFTAAQDKLAARVPSLLAAIEAALDGHEPMPTYGPALNPDGSSACGHDPDGGRHFEVSVGEWVCQGDPGPTMCARCLDTLLDAGEAEWPCAVYAAVTRELTKGEGGDGS
jgi:hypothetical protein